MINMTKFFFILFLFIGCIKIYAQNINYSKFEDSINNSQELIIERFEKLIEEAKKKGNLNFEMLVLMDLINYKLRDLGDIASSYEDMRYLETLVNKNPNEKAVREVEKTLYLAMGSTLQDTRNFDEALIYYDKAVATAEKNGDLDAYNDISCLRAQLLAKLGRRNEAIKIFKSFEKQAIETSNEMFQNRIYSIMSQVYKEEQKLDSALFYAKKSIDNFQPSNFRSFNLFNVAECYFLLNKEMDSVVYYAEKGLEIAVDNNLEKEQRYAHEILRQAYDKLGNYKEANDHFKKFYELAQQQLSYSNALAIGDFNTKQAKENSKIKDEFANEKLSNQRLVIRLVSSSLLLLMIAVIIIFNRLKLIKKQNKIISEEKAKAEQSEKYKEQFLANMSHEIRTPMHAISGMINSLDRKPHPKHQNKFLDAMKTSSDNLMNLLNDILDLSKISSGKLEIERIEMNPVEVVENVVKTLKYKAKEKGLELQIELTNDFPRMLIGDPARLNQILINLVGNAIKFTNEGYISILLSRINDVVEFAIKDTGSGISRDKMNKIFEVFEQGEKSKSQILGGTGLGLSISKQLVELQNGRIWVESVLGQGSTFFVRLPIIKSESAKEIKPIFLDEPQLMDIGKYLSEIKILLVEDDDFNVMVVKDDLNYFIPKLKIEHAKNGEDALKEFNSNAYDLILMDKHMPVLNGCEASKKIREIEKTKKIKKRIPIIAMTASLLKSEIEECINSGMDGYIPKPYKPEELITKIYEVFKQN